jgi:hypothetical protein
MVPEIHEPVAVARVEGWLIDAAGQAGDPGRQRALSGCPSHQPRLLLTHTPSCDQGLDRREGYDQVSDAERDWRDEDPTHLQAA